MIALQIHFHHIEADVDIGMREFFQVGIGGSQEDSPFSPVHGRRGPFQGIDLAGFDLDKDQGVLVSADQIDLPRADLHIAQENFQALAFQMPGGGLLTGLSPPGGGQKLLLPQADGSAQSCDDGPDRGPVGPTLAGGIGCHILCAGRSRSRETGAPPPRS